MKTTNRTVCRVKFIGSLETITGDGLLLNVGMNNVQGIFGFHNDPVIGLVELLDRTGEFFRVLH